MCGKTLRPSGQWAIPKPSTRGGRAPVISLPSKIMDPERGGTSPEMARRAVLLPAPFAPIKATSCPAFTSSEMPRSAVTPPYPQTRSRISSMHRSLSEIGLDHCRIIPNDLRRSLGDDSAVVQDDDAIRDAHHHRHVVLDKQDGDATVADLADEFDKILGFRGVHAGDRFIEQQHRRLRGERQRHADQALFAIGERARRIKGATVQPDPFEKFAGALMQPAFQDACPRQAENGLEKARSSLPMQSDHEVIVDRIIRENAGALKSADQTEVGDFMRFQSVQRRSAIADRAMSWPEKTGDDVEGGRFPGAVRSDQADDLSFADGEVEIRKRHETAEANGDLFDLQGARLHHHACSSAPDLEKATERTARTSWRRFANRCMSEGTMPRGRTKRMTIRSPP